MCERHLTDFLSKSLNYLSGFFLYFNALNPRFENYSIQYYLKRLLAKNLRRVEFAVQNAVRFRIVAVQLHSVTRSIKKWQKSLGKRRNLEQQREQPRKSGLHYLDG